MKICMKCRKSMIRILVISFLFLILLSEKVYAGNINGNESKVLGSMAATYEYDGKKYKLTDGYISQARIYLSQDEIDLTAEDAQEVLNTAYANIEQGVADGYLIQVENAPVESKEKETKKVKKPKAKSKAQADTPKFTIESNKETAVIEVRSSSGEQILKLPGIIKNTGFSIRRTILWAGFFTLTVFLVLGLAAKHYLFADYDE